MKLALVLTLWVCCAFETSALEPQRITLQSQDPGGAERELRAWWFASRQASAPVVIALHGCGGLYGKDGNLNARHAAMAQLLTDRGYAVLFPDSLTDRGIKTLCTTKFSERTLKAADRVHDVAAAVRDVQGKPRVDAARIYLLGWSHGGSVVLTAMDGARTMPELNAINKAAAFYPGCSAFAKRGNYWPRAPLQIHIGLADDWTPPQPCVALDGKGTGANRVRTFTYTDAVHDFDSPNTPLRRRLDVPNGVNPGQGVLVGGNPLAREAAYAQLLRFFDSADSAAN